MQITRTSIWAGVLGAAMLGANFAGCDGGGDALPIAGEEPPQPSQPLWEAAGEGRIDEVRANLYWGTDPNQIGPDGQSGLHRAARMGNIEVARLLIDHGADVDIAMTSEVPGRGNMVPLHWAARTGNLEMVRLLVEAGADVNARGGPNEDITPLQVAAAGNWADIVRYLAEHGGEM